MVRTAEVRFLYLLKPPLAWKTARTLVLWLKPPTLTAYLPFLSVLTVFSVCQVEPVRPWIRIGAFLTALPRLLSAPVTLTAAPARAVAGALSVSVVLASVRGSGSAIAWPPVPSTSAPTTRKRTPRITIGNDVRRTAEIATAKPPVFESHPCTC